MNVIYLALCLGSATPAQEEKLAAALTAEGGQPLPLVESHAEVLITNDLARVRVTQVFANPGEQSTSARYLFPLPHDAAVHAATLRTSRDVVRAQIKKVQEAQQVFAEAKAAGQTASLLTEHRANLFTQDVANIPGKDVVRIEIEYAERLAREDGRYRFHFPMAVGQRYANGANGISVEALSQPPPAAALAKGSGEKVQVSVNVRLATPLPITELRSPSHPVEIDQPSPRERHLSLARGRVPADRDFTLEYRLAGEAVSGGFVTERRQKEEFFSLLVEPPAAIATGEITPRELVYVIDGSCSMAGEPLRASKALVHRMLRLARPSDQVRVIRFGSNPEALSKRPLAATPENLERALRFVDETDGMGGTEIELALRAALEPPVEEGRLRMVLFLTDGFIGDEASVMATVHQVKGDARIFAFGVGDGVNRWLLEELAVAGRGVARIVGLNEDPDRAVEALASRLDAPILTHVSIDWGGWVMADVTPYPLPDLFAGSPLHVYGRVQERPAGSARRPMLLGWSRGRPVRVPLGVEALTPAAGDQPASSAIPVLWARSQVADRMRALTRPQAMRGKHDLGDPEIIAAITQLGLDFAITTRWTAFVAVSQQTVPQAAPPPVAAAPSGGSFGSAPEPVEWACFLLLLAAAAWAARRGRAST